VSELPLELRELIDAERAAPVSASRAAVRSRLAASVGGAPLGHAAGASLAGGAKVLAILALVVGAGTVATLTQQASPVTSQEARLPAVPRAPVSVSVARPAEPAPPILATHAEIAAPTRTRPSPRVRASLETPPSPFEEAVVAGPEAVSVPPVDAARTAVADRSQIAIVASEAKLLHRAWDARGNDPAQALALVIEDERLHPDGALAEERDALRISVLAKLDRLEDARVAATRFFVRHPDSVHRAMIETSIGATTDTKERPR